MKPHPHDPVGLAAGVIGTLLIPAFWLWVVSLITDIPFRWDIALGTCIYWGITMIIVVLVYERRGR